MADSIKFNISTTIRACRKAGLKYQEIADYIYCEYGIKKSIQYIKNKCMQDKKEKSINEENYFREVYYYIIHGSTLEDISNKLSIDICTVDMVIDKNRKAYKTKYLAFINSIAEMMLDNKSEKDIKNYIENHIERRVSNKDIQRIYYDSYKQIENNINQKLCIYSPLANVLDTRKVEITDIFNIV